MKQSGPSTVELDRRGMKVLHIKELLFHLPKDFEGSFSDALRLLASYAEAPRQGIQIPHFEAVPDAWDAFWLTLFAGGKVLCEGAGLLKGNPDGDGWVPMALGLGFEIPGKGKEVQPTRKVRKGED